MRFFGANSRLVNYVERASAYVNAALDGTRYIGNAVLAWFALGGTTTWYLARDYRAGTFSSLSLLAYLSLGCAVSGDVLVMCFVVGVAIHAMGHYYFEQNHPDSFRNPESILAAPVWLLWRPHLIPPPSSTGIARMVAVATVFAVAGCREDRVAAPAPNASEKAVEYDGRFPTSLTEEINGRPTRLCLTGRGVRKVLAVGLYEIASYCEQSSEVSNVDQLIDVDEPKQLRLLILRDISTATLTRGFEDGFARNDPAHIFDAEKRTMLKYLLERRMSRDDTITITHWPGIGVQIQAQGRTPITVDRPEFARVVWSMYMGERGVGREVRKALGTRLPLVKDTAK